MTFQKHSDAEILLQSARALIKALLNMPRTSIVDRHYRECLDVALWKITEAEWTHKHNTRYQSEAARIATKENKRHDHVFQRRKMIDELLKDPSKVDEIINKAVGCTITKDEHTHLNNFDHLYGWDRYEEADILIIDMETGQPHKF